MLVQSMAVRIAPPRTQMQRCNRQGECERIYEKCCHRFLPDTYSRVKVGKAKGRVALRFEAA